MQISDLIEGHLSLLAPRIEFQLAATDEKELLRRTQGNDISQTTDSCLIDLVLRADVLRVSVICLYTDGVHSLTDTQNVFRLASRFASQLASARPSVYTSFSNLSHESLGMFLTTWWQDVEFLGFDCNESKWRGLLLCQSTENQSGEQLLQRRFAERLLMLAGELIRASRPEDRTGEDYASLVRDLRRFCGSD